MSELELKTFISGELANNCYLVFDKESKKGFIVDAPSPSKELDEFIQEHNLQILFIALTHAHFDHIEGLNRYSVPFYVHQEDLPFLKESKLNGSAFFSSPVTIKNEPCIYGENQPLSFDKHPIEVIHTPGHTPGSVSLKVNNWLFSGDTLFFNSIGRTDIPLASESQLIKSIKEKILVLPPDTFVYPGHGQATSVGQEKDNNPFL
jgi:glyoxylase-like metal-dependent hydrolase (beta-lactamase superfamily II)